jgi:uncharacterized protein YndB with AHSA1/START domain
MPDILHEFPVKARPADVFAAVSTPAGLDTWWTKSSAGEPAANAEYELDFGPGYLWKARVTRFEPDAAFELEITEAMDEWVGARVGFELEGKGDDTLVRFHHMGWPEENAHYRGSCYCWAMYLRIMKRHIEHGEVVEYERRLDV